MSLIEIKDVDFMYREQKDKALSGVNLSIDKGEFISIIGSNGSGKSTLAKLLNVLLVPTQGQVFVDGLNSSDQDNVWKIRQKVGMVFQNPDNQLVATTVEDDVAFGPENLALPSKEIRERVDKSLDMVGMGGYQSHPPHELSGGQKQRIAIAGIIAMLPECIVLDEPTAMLDPMGRKEVLKTIKYLNDEEGITVILITHFMEETIFSDKIVVMQDGNIKDINKPLETFQNVDLIKNAGLDVPVAVQMANELRSSGIKLPDIMDIEELVDALC
ncbi:MAG: energy-coupling factor transporter ATPase [Halarsenatibacteraceae bacterium]